jgi:hypothetical protein
MFHTIEPALGGVWFSIGNFEKETNDAIKILPLVYGVSLYINHLMTRKIAF